MKIINRVLFVCLLSVQLVYGGFPDSFEKTNTIGGHPPLSWNFIGSWHFVDDDGDAFHNLFNVGSHWNAKWYPSQLSAEVFGKNAWSYGAQFSYTTYNRGKIINEKPLTQKYTFWAVDVFAKYHLGYRMFTTRNYNIYFPMGVGYTKRSKPPYFTAITLNLGAGVGYWIKSYLGVNLQAMAKVALNNKTPRSGANYLNYSVGVFYLIDNTLSLKNTHYRRELNWRINK